MKSKLLKQCRYYKGEKENPFEGINQNKAMFWFYEQYWVSQSERGLPPIDSVTLAEYEACGLKSFSINDGVPMSLKAVLFNRFMHWFESTPDEFKKFYKEQYLG